MKKLILSAEKDYTFSDFFELAYPVEDIVAEFGYAFAFEMLELPQVHTETEKLKIFQQEIINSLPKVSLHSEIARREFLIAPVLLQLLKFIDIRINAEYPLAVEKNLRGTLDYLVRSDKKFTVIEAKKGDLERGFTQLAVEMIAVSKYENEEPDVLFGAITTGDLWKFGKLEALNRKIIKDINTYRVPTDMLELFSILIGILK
ncbi:MAG: hypothetical protein D3911_00885 [Candidatus Electrothrix sp. AW3_4]|nr:hypothetical protein [Candidatus Electrothrix gigas]